MRQTRYTLGDYLMALFMVLGLGCGSAALVLDMQMRVRAPRNPDPATERVVPHNEKGRDIYLRESDIVLWRWLMAGAFTSIVASLLAGLASGLFKEDADTSA